MRFGIAGGSDAEVVAVADEIDEFVCELETAFDGGELRFALWRVASEGEDVIDAFEFEGVEDGGDFGFVGSDAGDVGHGFEADVVLDALDEFDGLASRSAACPVGDGDVGGFEGLE